MKIYSLYDRPADAGVTVRGESMTQQHFKDDCDVNRILEKYLRLGVWTSDPRAASLARQPVFGDFSIGSDFREVQEKFVEADRRFMTLSPKIRERFGNDPLKLLDFLASSENREEAVKLGLIDSTPVAESKAPAAPEAPKTEA